MSRMWRRSSSRVYAEPDEPVDLATQNANETEEAARKFYKHLARTRRLLPPLNSSHARRRNRFGYFLLVLTLFEAGGIGVVGGSLGHAGLALASMEASNEARGGGEMPGDVLDSVSSCAF